MIAIKLIISLSCTYIIGQCHYSYDIASYVAITYFSSQFLTSKVEIDTNYNLMRFNNRKPISVRKGPAWPYLHTNEEFWYGTATDNQGTGVIEGNYVHGLYCQRAHQLTDHVISDILL